MKVRNGWKSAVLISDTVQIPGEKENEIRNLRFNCTPSHPRANRIRVTNRLNEKKKKKKIANFTVFISIPCQILIPATAFSQS